MSVTPRKPGELDPYGGRRREKGASPSALTFVQPDG